MRSLLTPLALALLLAGCSQPAPAAPGDDGRLSHAAAELGFTGPGEPETAVVDIAQLPSGTAAGYILDLVCYQVAGERPDDAGGLLVEYAGGYQAPQAGVESLAVYLKAGDHVRNETSTPDDRGVLALGLSAEEWTGEVELCVYAGASDGSASLPAQAKAYVTTFHGGWAPAGFTAVP